MTVHTDRFTKSSPLGSVIMHPPFPLLQQPKPLLRGWLHRLAFITAIILSPILIHAAEGARGLASVYSVAIIALFGVSSTYHGHDWSSNAHELWRRIDHGMIFVAIASTYTPLAWLILPRTERLLILSIAWVGAACGILIMLFWPVAPRSLLVSLFILVGWSALLIIDDLWRFLSPWGFMLLICGGALHTLGAGVYAAQRPDPWPSIFGFHEIFHILVVFAVAAHYVLIAFFVLPTAHP